MVHGYGSDKMTGGILNGFLSAVFIMAAVALILITVYTSGKPATPAVKPIEHISSTGNVTHDSLMTHTERGQAFVLAGIVHEGSAGNPAFYMGMVKKACRLLERRLR